MTRMKNLAKFQKGKCPKRYFSNFLEGKCPKAECLGSKN